MAAVDFGLRTYPGVGGYVFDEAEVGIAGLDFGLREYQGQGLVYEVESGAARALFLGPNLWTGGKALIREANL